MDEYDYFDALEKAQYLNVVIDPLGSFRECSLCCLRIVSVPQTQSYVSDL